VTRRRERRDKGSISLFMVVIAVTLLAAVGLVVDGGIKVRALQRADETAREAARAGSQMLDVPAAVRGDAVAIDPAGAARAARAYLAAAGVDGTVRVSGNVVTVATRVDFTPVFLTIAGVGASTVTGTASARPVSGEEVP
jgi:Flp pilus assembly protein TadG